LWSTILLYYRRKMLVMSSSRSSCKIKNHSIDIEKGSKSRTNMATACFDSIYSISLSS
jgi:hypothetical protein